MISVISYLLIALAVLLAVPAVTLFLEIAGALIAGVLKTTSHPRTANHPRVAGLTPVQNESVVPLPTMKGILAQLSAYNRLVIGDNYNDNTALVAAADGAEVIAGTPTAGVGQTTSQLQTGNRPRVAVLIPAHNESAGLLPTIKDVLAQLSAEDRLVVVADNCDDDTALVAETAGAEVIERSDLAKEGKGYALDYGLKHLSLDPPQVVIIIDSDCRVSRGTIHQLALSCNETGRPAQALDLMTAPPNAPINFSVAEFAWRVKNWVRPLGLAAFNLPCQLMGTGMAIPWTAIHPIHVASGSLVEDLVLGLNLSQAGSAPLFCPSALVTSRFPQSAEGAKRQRYRWEQGHIQLIVTAFPRYLARAIADRNLSLLALTLDLAVPPLSLLMAFLVAMLTVTALAALIGLSSVAFTITAITFVALMVALLLAWQKFGQDVLPIHSSALVASYVAAKLPMYCRTLSGNIATRWVRTERKPSE